MKNYLVVVVLLVSFQKKEHKDEGVKETEKEEVPTKESASLANRQLDTTLYMRSKDDKGFNIG